MQTAHQQLVPGTVVVRPGDGTLQIGLDDRAVRVRDVGEPLVHFLHSLRGPRAARSSLTGQTSTGPTLPSEAAERLLGVLADAGLLDERPAGGVVSIIGAGALGAAITRLLCRDEISLLTVSASQPGHALAYDGPAARLVRQLEPLARASTTRVAAVGHWSKLDDTSPDVTVIAVDAPECDRVITETLSHDGRPHLLVRLTGRGVRVGPFVVPGHGPCVRCCDLTRRAQNPSWPRLLDQLTLIDGEADPPALAWGAATAAAQVLTFLATAHPETLGATLELAPPDWVVRMRQWRRHPDCDCHRRDSRNHRGG